MAVGVDFKALPPEEAIAFFQQKGYRPTFSYLDMMHRAHSDAFTVAGVTRLDVLQDIRSLVDDAIASGSTLADFKKGMQQKLSARGWWQPVEVTDEATGETKTVDLTKSRRLRTIFETNMRTSYAAGQWTRIQRTKKALPFLCYKTVGDGRVRPQHRAWHNVVLPVDHPWWETHFPPCDWQCRCQVVQMTAGMVKRAGLRVWDEPPDDGPPVAFTNPRTGEVTRLPKGIHPSFAYNPGEQSSFPDPARYTGAAFGNEAARLAVQSPAFPDLVAGDIVGAAPVGWVDDVIAKALDVTVRRVDLSSDTMAKQARRHPELILSEYRQLPDLVRDGLVVRDDEDGVIALFGILRDPEGQSRLYRAVLKRTGDGEALFLVTFHRERTRRLQAALQLPLVRDQEALREVRLSVTGLVE